MDERIEQVLKFWFGPPIEEGGPSGVELWFTRNARVDRTIERKFEALHAKAKTGQLDASWGATPRGRLALIIVLDQFSRNMYRDTPEMFSCDAKALKLCLDGLDDEMDKKLPPLERAFFYMPAMHSEDLDMQLTSVEVFTELSQSAPPEVRGTCEAFLKHAVRHRDVVERFERFPSRNAILGRTSTSEEATFLQQSGEM